MAAVAHRAGAPRTQSDDGDRVVISAIGPAGAVYPVGKMDAHRRGVQHIAVSVFIFSGDEMLIQRRAAGKYHSGLQWANACCSHPNWDEPIASAAQRRLIEELGIDLPLKAGRIIDYRADVGGGLIENERVHLFSGIADRRALVVAPDPAEVSETRWATRTSLLQEAAATPELFAPWFRIYLDRWSELGF